MNVSCSTHAEFREPAASIISNEAKVSDLLVALGASPTPWEFVSPFGSSHACIWMSLMQFSSDFRPPPATPPSSPRHSPEPDPLSLSDDLSAELLPPLELSPPRGKPLRCLVVEDNISNSKFLCRMLHSLGCETVQAFSGPQAVDLVCKELESRGGDGVGPCWRSPPFDICFCDRDMLGEYDGFEAARRIRHLPSCIELPIVATTGSERPADIRPFGLDAFLSKPLNRTSIESIVDSVRRRGARRNSVCSIQETLPDHQPL